MAATAMTRSVAAGPFHSAVQGIDAPGMTPAKRKRAPAKKTAKKAKAAPKKEATGARGRAPNFADNAKIKMVTRENPCREGTSAHEYFETAKASRTFGAYREAGGNLKYLYSFSERGLLTIEG